MLDRSVYRIAVLVITALALPLVARAAGPKTETRDGVPVVLNGAAPRDGAATVDLEELWRTGAGDDEEFFGVISAVRTDAKGWTYALDRQLNEVKVYDANGVFQKTIGHEGEGPGEFRGGSALFFLDDGRLAVVQAMPGKIVLLSPDGTPAGDFPLPEDPAGGMRFLANADASGDNAVLQLIESARGTGKIEQTLSLVIGDAGGHERARLSEVKNSIDFANPVFDEHKTLRVTWASGADGRVYVVPDPFGPYRIQVYGPDGRLDRVIEREYEHRRRNAKEKEDAKARIIIRGLPDPKMEVADVDPDILGLYPTPDGGLWVRTSRGIADLPDGVLGVFDVFDSQGAFVRQVTVRGEGTRGRDAFHITGGRFYVARRYADAMDALFAQGGADDADDDDGDAEPMELIAYRMPRLP